MNANLFILLFNIAILGGKMKLTPAMQQFMKIKNEHPDCILLFRMGDFYETFFDDAKTVSRALNIVLTSRGKDKVPLAGIPYHSIDPYLAKLVKQGFKIAIVEQLEDPKKAKGLVKRGLVKIITPGTVLDENVLDEKKNNYLVSICDENNKYGITLVDNSTGDFLTTELKDIDELINEIRKFNPSEIIIPPISEKKEWVKKLKKYFLVNSYNDVFFYYENSYKNLCNHFNTKSLSGFGLEGKKLSISSSGAIISYLKETQMSTLSYVTKIRYYNNMKYMVLDSTTIRNLELFTNVFDNTEKGSLISVIDKTITPMGSRKLKSWLIKPLLDIKEISKRHDSIQELIEDQICLDEIRKLLKKILDIQRLLSRINNNLNCPKDLIGLSKSLFIIPKIRDLLKMRKIEYLNSILNQKTLQTVADVIDSAIREDAPSHIRDGNMIKEGYSKELDEIKGLSKNAKKYILELEKQEREKTGIKSLKIRYNRIFGYFIEVTKANLELVPDNYIRKQTQVNCERFITQELKEKEELILNASEKQIKLEHEIYEKIVNEVIKNSKDIVDCAEELSVLDVVCGFSFLAINNRYVKPDLNEGFKMEINDGRHPVIEAIEQKYIPNDCSFDESKKMMIITGPNMSGKSSFMRQNALIIILAQIGCFVPAKSANIGIVDKIYTRIGAFDDISSGQSTFMVEMNETANIVNNATDKSFIILDEIGRGTSTYDGISLAWAIAEYIITKIKAKTLFATHYHQLNRLSDYYSKIKNYNITVLEEHNKIIFLYKIIEGGTDKSYGIEVAKLAGLPKELIENARKAMYHLEVEDEVSDKLYKPLMEKAKNKKISNEDKMKVSNGIKQLKLDSWKI